MMIPVLNREKDVYNVNVYQTDATLTISDCKWVLPWEELFSSNQDVLEKIEEERFLYVFQFGMVGFFNPSKHGKSEICRELRQLYKKIHTDCSANELNVVIHKNTCEFSFNKVALPPLDEIALRKLLYTIAQSVALDKYTKIIQRLWTITTEQNALLRAHGKLNISPRQLKKHLGSLWAIKTEIAEKVNDLNTFQDNYENANTTNIDIALRQAFVFPDSLLKTNERLAIIQENLELFKAILDQKESSRLEWIIIILIAVEIVDLFVLRFLKWLL